MTIDMERQTMLTPADWIPGQGHWTYNTYAALPEDGHRYEIVDGVLLDMTPAPGIPHQKAVQVLFRYLATYITDTHLGQVFISPIDVELMPRTVFQPDIIVILHEGLRKITESHIIGAPDLVIEVAAPGTSKYDKTVKREAYALAGVTEYWLANPAQQTVEVLSLQNASYQSMGILHGMDTIVSQVVPTMVEVHVEQFFV